MGRREKQTLFRIQNVFCDNKTEQNQKTKRRIHVVNYRITFVYKYEFI